MMSSRAAEEQRDHARLGLVIALHVPLAIGFAAGLVVVLASARRVAATDFSVFWTAWWLILHGQGAHLYDQAAQRAAQHHVMGGLEFEGGLMAFLNPPHAALAGVPLGWLADHAGERAALAVWMAANLALVGWLVHLVHETLALDQPRQRWAATLVVLGFYPVLYTVSVGQLSIVLAVAAFQLYRATERDTPWAAAAWLMMFSIKPQLLPPLLAFLVARRHWTVLARAVAMAVAIVALTALALGPSIWPDYVRGVHGLERFFGTGTPAYMMNLRGLLTRLLGSAAAPERVYAAAAAAWLLSSAALGLALSRRPGDARGDYALALAVALLFSPHLFAQDAVLWVSALAFHIAALRGRGAPFVPLATFVATWPTLFALARVVDLGSGSGPMLRVDPVVTALLVATVLMVRDRRSAFRASGPQRRLVHGFLRGRQ
jgi:hypothetical protein